MNSVHQPAHDRHAHSGRLMATLHARLQPGADPERVVSDIKMRLAEAHGIRHATVEAESGRECADAVKRRANGTA